MNLFDHYLEAHERRARAHLDVAGRYPTAESLSGNDYTPPVHWGEYPDGVRIYEGSKLLVTLTPERLRAGLMEECARVVSRAK